VNTTSLGTSLARNSVTTLQFIANTTASAGTLTGVKITLPGGAEASDSCTLL